MLRLGCGRRVLRHPLRLGAIVSARPGLLRLRFWEHELANHWIEVVRNAVAGEEDDVSRVTEGHGAREVVQLRIEPIDGAQSP